jgi:hypothetical protein
MSANWRFLWVPIAWAALIAVAVGLTRSGWYGLVLFALLPLLMGALVEWSSRAETTAEALLHGAVTGAVGCLFFLAVGIEGLICTVMALPLAVPLGMLGSVLAFKLREGRASGRVTALVLLPLGIGSAGYDAAVAPRTYQITTSIEIAADPLTVWRHVIAYADMPEPTDWVFRTGIGYPQRVRLEGTGVGATRYCDFSTGSFVEPIVVWEPGRHLEFDVIESAESMKEWSPYGDIHPAHLHGYFISKRGRFLLTPLPNGHTFVEGTSWYQHGLEPAPYWRWWSDAIVHRIHRRVLDHIKVLAES